MTFPSHVNLQKGDVCWQSRYEYIKENVVYVTLNLRKHKCL